MSVIIPAYNEEECIEACLEEVERTLSRKGLEFDVIVVDDGSNDETAAKVAEVQKKHANIYLHRHENNFGVGAALRTGLDKASGDWLFFMPADSQFDIKEIDRFLPYLGDYDVIAGEKSSHKDYSLYRKINSVIFIFIYRLLFGLKLRDYNYVQMYKKEVVDNIDLSSEGIFITGEILAKAWRKGAKIKSVKATYISRKAGMPTGGKLKNVLKTVWEMMRIWLYFHLKQSEEKEKRRRNV